MYMVHYSESSDIHTFLQLAVKTILGCLPNIRTFEMWERIPNYRDQAPDRTSWISAVREVAPTLRTISFRVNGRVTTHVVVNE